jgi:fructokinase
VDGEIWTGPQHVAGEWGHHRIADDGPPCYCGQRGCVETFLSGPALERAWVEAGGDPAPAGAVAARAATGDARAVAVLDRYVDRFGRALANVVNVLDPDVVVLGGGMSNLDVLYGAGVAAVARYVFNDELRTPIVRNALGDAAGVVGAAWLAA